MEYFFTPTAYSVILSGAKKISTILILSEGSVQHGTYPNRTSEQNHQNNKRSKDLVSDQEYENIIV